MKALLMALALSTVLGSHALIASAQSLDPASAEALGAVLRTLGDPTQRAAAIAADPRAAAADNQIRALAASDPKLMEEFYGLAAQVFGELTRGSGGDVTKMRDALTRAQSDPAAFAAMLSPATLDRLRDLATRMSDQRR
jgi:hypothetical protein